MRVTCGVFIFDKNGLLLIGHPTGFPYGGNIWSVPKGEPDEGEAPDVTAIREVKEETTFVLDPTKVTPLGTIVYKSGKKTIHAFYTKLDTDSKDLKAHCYSFFVDKEGNNVFEIDIFRWVNIKTAALMLHESQVRLLDKAWEAFNNSTNG